MTAIDWDDAFANSAYIPGSEALPDLWATRAVAYRVSGVCIDTDIAYGARPREEMDMVWPDATPKRNPKILKSFV